MVLAPEHPFVESIRTPTVTVYVTEARNRSDVDRRAIIVTYQPANFPALKSGLVRNIDSSSAEASTDV